MRRNIQKILIFRTPRNGTSKVVGESLLQSMRRSWRCGCGFKKNLISFAFLGQNEEVETDPPAEVETSDDDDGEYEDEG